MRETNMLFYHVVLLAVVLPSTTHAQIVHVKTTKAFNGLLRGEDTLLVDIGHVVSNEAKRLEELHRGLFKMAHVSNRKLLAELLEIKIPKETKFVAFPYGSKRTKIAKCKQIQTENITVAIATVSDMTPDITVKLRSSVDQSNSQLRGFFQHIFITRPIKFPVIYFTNSKTTPLEIKILALQYSNLFQIGVIAQPTKNALEAYAIKKLPHFSGYVLEEVTSRPQLKNYVYQGELRGPAEYPFLARFLYLLHKNHFHEMPKIPRPGTDGDVKNEDKDDVDLEEAFSDDFELFRELYKMFPMEFSKDEL